MNGNTNGTGILPTVELATTNGNGYGYPVMPFMGGYGNNGLFGGDGIWAIILLALLFGNGGWGGFGGGYGNGMFEFPWLLTGQQGINANTNNGFDTLHLSNQLDTVNSGIYSLSNQLCNCCADMNQTVSNGFYNAEIAANNRQMANMNTAFDLSRQFADCCCENRLGIQDLKATVISENCSDREVLREIGQNILVNQTANTQKIIDEIFRDRLDEKDSKIAELNREILMKDLNASQLAQTQSIISNVYSELKNCPVGTVPAYGNTPIFSCANNGCGCTGTTSQFI